MVTTIKLNNDTKASLENEQLPGESFDDTVSRLLGESPTKFTTPEEVREIADEQITARVISEAQE